MSSEWQDLLPNQLEEGYWEALLREGEHAEPVHQHNEHFEKYPSHTSSQNGCHANQISHVDPTALAHDWDIIEQIMANDEILELNVIGHNRGGLLVEWHNLRGFVPASQLIDFPVEASPIIRRENLINQIGKKLNLRIIELNRDQNRLVLSERAAQANPGEREHILDTLYPGDIIEGCVTNITEFGVFVDLGGLEGLIHISELSWGRVNYPGDILERDERVKVYVLDTNKHEGRVALSIKQLTPDPWKTVNEHYRVGQIIQGKITNVVDFGAFARLEKGLEGLIHVSELAEGHFLHPRNVVHEGQTVNARILSIDSHARRLGLSLREVPQYDETY